MNRLLPYGAIIFIIVIIIFLFRLNQETLELTALVGGSILVVCMGAGLFLFGLNSWQQFRILKAKAKLEEYRTESARYNIHQDGFGMLHLHDLKTNILENLSANPTTHHNGTWVKPDPVQAQAWFALVGKRRDDSPVPLLTQGEPVKNIPELLPLLDKAERVLVKGPSDSGKTTLFKNIANRSENVIVVDPHYAPGIWPSHCKIIGKGRNHNEITAFLNWLSSELDKRYKLRAEGKEDYKPLTVIIDEWMSVSNKCANATQVITEMITESRKSKIRLFIGSHSDQVEALGIRGQGKLREGLLIVRLEYDQVTKERSSTFDYGKGERPCLVPSDALILNSKEIEFELKIPDMIIMPDKIETEVVELFKNGMSPTRIAIEKFGQGGNQKKKVDEILVKNGLV